MKSTLALFLSVLSLNTLADPPRRMVSLKGNTNLEFIRREKLLPRGSALMTTSGTLRDQGITAIIHAAPAAMSHTGGVYEPSVRSLRYSIRNSMILARRHGHKRVALPFIGGGIFASRMNLEKEDLARLIIRTVAYNKMNLEMVFVLFTDSEAELFTQILQNEFPRQTQLSVVQGSITDASIHNASAIINAANMEVQFGGGVSGAIGRATGDAEQIDAEAASIIDSL